MNLSARAAEAVRSVQRRLLDLPSNACMVTGSPRAGTTALVRWLDTQGRVYSFSESRAMYAVSALAREAQRHRRLSRKPEVTRVVARDMLKQYYMSTKVNRFGKILIDKEPIHPLALGDVSPIEFISSLRYALPDLKLVLMIRDPVATVWSMTKRKWGHSMNDAEDDFRPLPYHIEVWKASADLILALGSPPGVYVCQFERLCADPDAESRRLLGFLGIRGAEPFVPRPTKTSGFGAEDLDRIRAETAGSARELGARGVVDLSLWQ